MADQDNPAAEYVRELRARRRHYREEAYKEIQRYFQRRDRRPPDEFHDSSFLYVRSYDGDLGQRPFSNIVFWHSPDLTISPLKSTGSYTTTLNAGESYLIRCQLRNRGDLAVPSAKVELFLLNPSLGFDTRVATNLTLGQVPTVWVGSDANATAEFVYTVPPTESGHKCLFARVFSFSPLELPIDDYQLDPRLDRHVAQQNLNIVGQAQPFAFDLIHAPNARVRITLRALETEELLALRHPVLADVRPAPEFPREGWARLTQLTLQESDGGVEVTEDHDGLALEAHDAEGMDLDRQRELHHTVREVLRAIEAGETRRAEHRDLFAAFREMTAQLPRRTTFGMVLPALDLAPDQAIGLEVRATDENLEEPETMGGITLIVVGG